MQQWGDGKKAKSERNERKEANERLTKIKSEKK